MVRWALMRWLMGLVAVVIAVPAALALGAFGLTEWDWLAAFGGMFLLVYAVLSLADAAPLQLDTLVRYARSREKLPWIVEPDLSRPREIVSEIAENIQWLTRWGQACGTAGVLATLAVALAVLSGSLRHLPDNSGTSIIIRVLGVCAPVLVCMVAVRMGRCVVGMPAQSEPILATLRFYGSLLGCGLLAAVAAFVAPSQLPGLMVGESWFFFGLFALCAASALYCAVRLAALVSCLEQTDFATMAVAFSSTIPDCSAALLPRLRSAAADASQVLDLPEGLRRSFYARLLQLTGAADRDLWLGLFRASTQRRDPSLMTTARKLAPRAPTRGLADLNDSIAAYEAAVGGSHR
ncbi:MAG: hypothetical protein GX446_16315 [Chthonomonadales bacterium]|nr:hypothetical protein [Chthonomonadales bacterium]